MLRSNPATPRGATKTINTASPSETGNPIRMAMIAIKIVPQSIAATPKTGSSTVSPPAVDFESHSVVVKKFQKP